METIFEQIINKKLPADILYEDDDVIAIKDKFPVAEIHFLIISKKRIESFQKIKEEDFPIINKMILTVQKLAKEYNVDKGYRVASNIGLAAGQSVFHLHFHLLAGKSLKEI